MNEFTENESLPNLELKFIILENLRKPLTLKSMRKRFAIRAISVFQVKFNVEFTRQAVNVSIEFVCYQWVCFRFFILITIN